jgi:hypothetical protein
MSPLSPRLTVVAGGATDGSQMSQPKAIGARRDAAGPVSRDAFLMFWSGLMLRRCGSAREVAYQFRRTEQTGRNWIDGFACPTGLDVARAYQMWPEDFDGVLQDLRAPQLRRAA